MTQPSSSKPEISTLNMSDMVESQTPQSFTPDQPAAIRYKIAHWRICWLRAKSEKASLHYFDGTGSAMPPKEVTSDSSWSQYESTTPYPNGSIETKIVYPNGSTTRITLSTDATSTVMSLSVDGSLGSCFSVADPGLYQITEIAAKHPSSRT